MSEFNNTESNVDAFWYDKNEFYAEYGLSKGAKKDSKSRSMKEREKAEQRKKKVNEIVSSLPNKMQKKIAQITSTLPKTQSKPSKSTKQINYVSRKNTREDVAYNEDEDANDYDEDPDTDDEEYKLGLSMWLKYGLTKKQYDADLEHRANIAALDAFEEDPENYHAIEYGEMLRQKIKKFEDDIEAQHSTPKPDYPDEDECIYPVYEDDDDIAERYREYRMESAIENARDDMREDY